MQTNQADRCGSGQLLRGFAAFTLGPGPQLSQSECRDHLIPTLWAATGNGWTFRHGRLPGNHHAIRCAVRTATKIVLATSAVALLHSALASRSAKQTAARLVGTRKRDLHYRRFYIAQSLLSFGALGIYIARLPNRSIWKLGTGGAGILNTMRIATLWELFRAVRQIGFTRISGLQKAPAPEAQGPDLTGDKPVTGPFHYSRHPLNFLSLPLIWLTPRMTRNRFAFNCVATVYFVIGSIHEEHRLRLAYGDRYQRYQGETKFFFGRKQKRQHAPGTTQKESLSAKLH